MATCILRDTVVVGDYGRPYITAEVNTSHGGSIDTAREMIDRAKDAGCDCVKFQSWSAESLYSSTYYDQNPVAKRIVKKFAFGEAQLMEVAAHCASRGIAFASTPYSEAEVEFLVGKCNAPYVKVASMDLVNYPFLYFIARCGVAVVLSTGMGTMEEVRRAVGTIEDAGNGNICLLHCISIYPPEIASIRLNNILGLRAAFPSHPVGFSDHSLGTEMATAAVALGAAMVEKHLTLDRTRIGMDNQMASEPEELAQLVRHCHNVNVALGGTERIVSPAELDQRLKMRRSVTVVRDVPAGAKLTRHDLGAKRPGTGFPPEMLPELVGRVVKNDLKADTLVREADLVDTA